MMTTVEPLMMACIGDISGKVRGKGFPIIALDDRLNSGIGWTPTNVQITCFNSIAPSPFGALGDLVLWPDPATDVKVSIAPGPTEERFILGDLRNLDGLPWTCCLRSMLRSALDRFNSLTGLNLVAAFEHEFMFKDDTSAGAAYSLMGFRHKRTYGEIFLGALRQAGIMPDTFLREFGDKQYEVTVEPAVGLTAADNALILRELAYATAQHCEEEITFTPLIGPNSVGNGVHIHISFRDQTGTPATFDPTGINGLSETAAHFIGGILTYLESIIAFTAPSHISYARLAPHRWSAAYNNLGIQDREAAIRICPTSAGDDVGRAQQFNFEFRAADATANPHLLLASLVMAGIQGIQDQLPAPVGTHEDVSVLAPEALTERGIVRLPTSLDEALAHLDNNQTVRSWYPDGFVDIYLAHKRAEIKSAESFDQVSLYRAYSDAY